MENLDTNNIERRVINKITIEEFRNLLEKKFNKRFNFKRIDEGVEYFYNKNK